MSTPVSTPVKAQTGGRYVALGSSMVSGPGIGRRVPGTPRAAMRSERNYPRLLAADLGLDVVDVSFTGATTAHVLTDHQLGEPPQVSALDGTERLVTITIGGNDIGYVPGLMAATLDRWLLGMPRRTPIAGRALRDVLDPDLREQRVQQLPARLRAIGRTVRQRAPYARVVFVDYLTILPKHGLVAPPLSSRQADVARYLGSSLEHLTREAAAATDCEYVAAGKASRDHHAWTDDPWMTGARLPIPGRVLAYHPTQAGMRAVADLIATHLGWPASAS